MMMSDAATPTRFTSLSHVLSQLAVGRDPQAWADLVSQVGPDISRLVSRLICDHALCEDAIQETFLLIRNHAGQFTPQSGHTGAPADADAKRWIMRVTTNACISLLRKAQTLRRRYQHVATDVPAQQPSPDDVSERNDDATVLRRELSALPLHYSEALILHYLVGEDYLVLSEQLQVPVATARTRIHRGLKALRTRLMQCGLTLSVTALGTQLSNLTPPASGSLLTSATMKALLHSSAQPATALAAPGPLSLSLSTTTLGIIMGSALSLTVVAILVLSSSATPAPAQDQPAASNPITLTSLLEEMVDRDHLVRYPAPAYLTGQASSYDRASVAPDQPGWFGNKDYDQCIRTETIQGRKEFVIMDAAGPGAITRMWKGGNDGQNHIRIYLDGADTPVLDEVADAWLSGQLWLKSPLSAECSRGHNGYLPIPYAKHCKVTLDRLQEDWYNIEYRTYPAKTQVTSFTKADIQASAALIERVGHELIGAGEGLPANLRHLTAQTKALTTGKSCALTSDSPGAIRQLTLKVTGADEALALRSTVLSISFDGEQTVWCPVGDFFGSGVGLNIYHDWYREVAEDGTMRCWWIMPFHKSAVVTLTNLGKEPVTVTVGPVDVSSWSWDDRTMVFHSTWRQEYPIMTKKGEGTCDWNYVKITGKGVYVGDTLAMHNGSSGWWGEGDEKIWVDGETFPSHFGTGSEDYYGYAWGDQHVFDSPFHSQPRGQGNSNIGNTNDTRVRSLDAVPFTHSLNFDLEVWHWDATEVAYAAATYWYACPGATSNRTPAPDEAARGPVPVAAPGRIEGESMAIKGRPPGILDFQCDPRWSAGGQLGWREGKNGDRLDLIATIDKTGRYTTAVIITTSPEMSIVQFSIDGVKSGAPVDAYAVALGLRTVDLGVHALTAGDHVLSIEITGVNPAVGPRRDLGLDCFTYQPAP